MDTTTKEKTDLEQFQALRIEALEKEIDRLNDELLTVKQYAYKARLTDPAFYKPISQIETTFEVINPKQENYD